MIPPALAAVGSFGGVAFLVWYLVQRVQLARSIARSHRIQAAYAQQRPPPFTWHRYRCEDCGEVVPLMGVDGKPCPIGKPNTGALGRAMDRDEARRRRS